MVNTILKEADLFCPNSVRINFTIYHKYADIKIKVKKITEDGKCRGRLTYGYRRVQDELIKLDVHIA
ncbi:hypothetical protein, partial [Levilactobacillus brevis]|uniref:hypothetical protein n=1 Tax=Levilactobacillus brevis TaxID=1580 RepID=UPI0020739979